MPEQTLYEKYGGFSNISKIVMSFYDTLLDSDEIGPYFDEIDMAKMVDHQTKFIASVLGGPASYSDHQLRQVHSHLAITHSDFDELEKVLQATLQKHGVAAADIDAVAAEFGKRRSLIVR